MRRSRRIPGGSACVGALLLSVALLSGCGGSSDPAAGDCLFNVDCAKGERCLDGDCVPVAGNGCRVHQDCPSGSFCSAGVCQPVDPGICTCHPADPCTTGNPACGVVTGPGLVTADAGGPPPTDTSDSRDPGPAVEDPGGAIDDPGPHDDPGLQEDATPPVDPGAPFVCTSDPDCDDSDPCTSDRCKAGGGCDHDPFLGPGCCTFDLDCDDGDPCSIDACVGGSCTHDDGNCCTLPSDCNDGLTCTVDNCLGGTCTFTPIPSGCCQVDAECDDGSPCTADTCEGGGCKHQYLQGCCAVATDCLFAPPCGVTDCVDNTCSFKGISNCCKVNADCSDGDSCTIEVCNNGTCVWTPKANCCTSDDTCPEKNCRVATCTAESTCVYTEIVGCCVTNLDCNDKNSCTLDICEPTGCKHPVKEAPACCALPADCTEKICSVYECVEHGCVEAGKIPNCCTKKSQCNDKDTCTVDTCDAHECGHTLTGEPGCTLPSGISERFDGEVDGWLFQSLYLQTKAVAWQPVKGKRYVSAPGSLYFGDVESSSYGGGVEPVGGVATSPLLRVPQVGATLRFQLYKDTESAPQNDVLVVQILSPGGVETQVWSTSEAGIGSTVPGFKEVLVDLSAFADQELRLRFRFDSKDGVANGGEGLYVDDLVLGSE